MNNIKQVAVSKAISILNATGAQFKVIFEGAEYGDLQVVAIKLRKASTSYKALYMDRLNAMQVGDVEVWSYDGDIEGLRGAVSATACSRWGAGNSITRVNGKTLELLRVA